MTKVQHKQKKKNHYSYSKVVKPKRPFEYWRVFNGMLLLAALGCELYVSIINGLPWVYANMAAVFFMFLGMAMRQIPFMLAGFIFGLIGAIATLANSMRSIWLLWEYMIDQMFASSILLIAGSVLAVIGYILYIAMCIKKNRILVKGLIATLFCLINVSIYGFAWGSYSLTLWHLPMILGMLYLVFNVNRIAKSE